MPEPTIPMSEEAAEKEAQRLITSAYQPTSYRDTTPIPRHGTAPPVPQPGRPPMSQRATDLSGLMLAAGAASLPIGGMTSLVLYTLGHVDPVQLAIGGTVPVAFVAAIGFVVRSLRSAGPEPEVHHHYEGPVYQDQRNVHSSTRGVWAKNTNH